MIARMCEECGSRPARYFMIHPLRGRPVRVCAACEERLAERTRTEATETRVRRPTPVLFGPHASPGTQGPATA